MATVDVGIVINARNNASATINQIQQQINQLNKSLSSTGSASNVASKSMGNMLSKFNTTAASVFILYQTITKLGFGLLKMGGDAQKASQSLIITTGTVAAATQQFQLLTKQFGPAGFAIENMIKNFNSLRGAGLGLDDANRTLTATADAVTAFGGSQQDIDKAVLALSQIGSKGVLQMEELRGQLSEAIPIAMALMADQAGISMAELNNRVKAGLISSEEAIRLFTEGAEELFGGLAEAQANTLSGAVSQLGKAVNLGLIDLFDRTDLDERITLIVQDLTAAILNFFASIDQQAIDDFFHALERIADVGSVLVDIFSSLYSAFTFVYKAISPLIDFLNKATQAALFLALAIVENLIVGLIDLQIIIARMAGNHGLVGFFQALKKEVADNAKGIDGFLSVLDGSREKVDLSVSEEDAAKFNQLKSESEASAAKLADLQKRQLDFNRQNTDATKEELRVREQLSDLLASTSAQYNGSVVDFISNIDRVANRMADILGVETRLIPLRQAALALSEGMSVEAIRQMSIVAAMEAGASETTAGITANAIGTALNDLIDFRTKVVSSMRDIEQAQAEAFGELTGDRVRAAVVGVTIEYDRQLASIQNIKRDLEAVNDRTDAEQALLAEINRLLNESNTLRGLAVERARAMAEFAEREAAARSAMAVAAIQEDTRKLARANSDSPLGQMAAGTQAGQTMERVAQERAALQAAIQETAIQMDALRVKASTSMGAAAQQALEELAALQTLQEGQVDAMSRLSEAADLSRQLWQDVGGILEKSVGDAIYGLITATATLEDVGRQMFASLTRAAIDYIVQLMIIQALKMAAGMANGGVVPGGSTPVQSVPSNPPGLASGGAIMGGIISGPTMFLAGEAGKEAIMPLANIGGKLGVRASGGGGDTFNINISAIDTQSGMQFLMKNMDTITGGLSKSNLLNRGTGRYRA